MRKKEQRRTTSELVVFNVTFWSKYTFISTMYQQLEHRITRLVLIYKLFFFTFFVCLNRYCNWTLWHALSNLKIRREICTMHLRLSVPSPHTPPPSGSHIHFTQNIYMGILKNSKEYEKSFFYSFVIELLIYSKLIIKIMINFPCVLS